MASIAFIGLGNMGLPMAACLLKAGFQVTGFDLSEAARAKFQAAGGRVAATASDAAKTADVVITLLPDGKIVRAVLEPLKKGFKPGAIIVDMSSSDPIGTQELGNSLIAAGFEFIDAPISGGVKRATDGTLAIMVGGDGATIDGLGPDNLAARAQDMAGVLMRFQSGYLYHYAFVMLVGVAGLVTYFMMTAAR